MEHGGMFSLRRLKPEDASEKEPQKVDCGASSEALACLWSFREQQARLRRAVARHKDLQDGVVLDTMEKGGEEALENTMAMGANVTTFCQSQLCHIIRYFQK